MNRSRSWRLYLLGTGLGVFLATLASPRTGWVARDQVGAMIHGATLVVEKLQGSTDGEMPAYQYTSQMASPDGESLREEAKRHADDVGIQIAAATIGSTGTQASSSFAVPELERVVQQFGTSAEARAALVRRLAATSIKHREEDIASMSDEAVRYLHSNSGKAAGYVRPPNSKSGKAVWEPTEQRFMSNGSFDTMRHLAEIAEQSETLEPHNAFFPAMASIGWFWLGEDERGEMALHRAAECHIWEDYLPLEVQSLWRLKVLCGASPSSVQLLSIWMACVNTHLAPLRTVAQVAAARATSMEIRGNIRDGVRLRTDVMRLGQLMRSSSRTIATSQTGIDVFSFGAASRAVIDTKAVSQPMSEIEMREDEDTRWLPMRSWIAKNGYPRIADWMAAERLSNRQFDDIRQDIENRNGGWKPFVVQSAICQAVNASLLVNAVLLMLLGLGGGIVTAIARRNNLESKSMGVWSRIGYMLLITLVGLFMLKWVHSDAGPVLLGCAYFLGIALGWQTFGMKALVPMAILPVFGIVSGEPALSIGISMLGAAAFVLATHSKPSTPLQRLTFGVLALTSTAAVLVGIGVYLLGDGYSIGLGLIAMASPELQPPHVLQRSASLVVGLTALPILVIVVVAVRCFVSRQQAYPTPAAVLSYLAPCLAGLVLLAFCGSALRTVSVENQAVSKLATYLNNEPAAEAATIGRPWPTAIPFPEEELR